MRHLTRATAFAAVVALTACSTGPTAPGGFQVTATSSAEAAQAAALISRYRVARGLPPVAADVQLNRAAEAQARAVAEAGHLSHGAFGARMASFGVPGHAAENLSAGVRSVDQAVARWQASPGHDANLLMPEARRIGLARADAESSRYGRYWALVLAQ